MVIERVAGDPRLDSKCWGLAAGAEVLGRGVRVRVGSGWCRCVHEISGRRGERCAVSEGFPMPM